MGITPHMNFQTWPKGSWYNVHYPGRLHDSLCLRHLRPLSTLSTCRQYPVSPIHLVPVHVALSTSRVGQSSTQGAAAKVVTSVRAPHANELDSFMAAHCSHQTNNFSRPIPLLRLGKLPPCSNPRSKTMTCLREGWGAESSSGPTIKARGNSLDPS